MRVELLLAMIKIYPTRLAIGIEEVVLISMITSIRDKAFQIHARYATPFTMKYCLPAVAAAASLFLASCGTTSSLRDAQGAAIAPAPKFSKVVVQNYTSTVTDDEADKAQVAASGFFPDHIVNELREEGGFTSVSRTAKPDTDTLVIEGVVTRYVEGNAALRLLVGMGAGSSHFDATTQFKDAKGNVLGKIESDKVSWALGGGLAASQTTQKFMKGAAEKIAEEAHKLAK